MMRYSRNLTFHSGHRLPVLALHSSASTGGQWKALTRQLGAQSLLAQTPKGQRSILTPDLPGYGKASDCAALIEPATLAGEADWLLRSAGLPAGPFHLIGHSYGGALALKLALRAPQRVRSLTLVEPVLFHLLSAAGNRDGGETEKKLYRQILGLRDRVRGAVAAGWPAHGMTAFVDFWSGAGAWQDLDLSTRQNLALQAKSVLRNFEAVLSESWSIEDVGRLRMPVQTIVGSRSPDVTRRLVELLIDNLPAVTGTRIFDAGHMAPLTHAASVNAAMLHHIRQAEGIRPFTMPLPSARPLVA